MRISRVLIALAIMALLASAVVAQTSNVSAAGGGGGGYGGGASNIGSSGGGYGGNPRGNDNIGVPKSDIVELDQRILQANAMIKQYQIMLDSDKRQIETAKERVKTGLVSPGDSGIADHESHAAQVEQQLVLQKNELQTLMRLKALASPVDVTLKSSTIRQAAEALSRASRMNIAVDPKVPQDVKVNAEAQNVPLGAVLEVIANAAGLIISPNGEDGVLLRLPGKLVVNDNVYTTDGEGAPWSDEWGMPPNIYYDSIGRKWLWLFHSFGPTLRWNSPTGPGTQVLPPTAKPAPAPAPAPGQPAAKPIKGGGGK